MSASQSCCSGKKQRDPYLRLLFAPSITHGPPCPAASNGSGSGASRVCIGLSHCPASISPCACERSGQQYARFTRTRVFINPSTYEKKAKEVGQWVTAFDLGTFLCPTLILNSGAGQTAPKSASRGDVFADIRRAFSYQTHIFTDGIKSGLLPPESTCKK